MLLITGSVGALTELISISGVILVLGAMGLTGAWLSSRLPDVT